jgi:hypothetical protein
MDVRELACIDERRMVERQMVGWGSSVVECAGCDSIGLVNVVVVLAQD